MNSSTTTFVWLPFLLLASFIIVLNFFAPALVDAKRNDSPNNKCNPDDKFLRCCRQIQFNCRGTSSEQLAIDACRYPPSDLGVLQKTCLAGYINEYIMCYADGHNNRPCCVDAAVPQECRWLKFKPVDCTDFCRGDNHHIEAKPSYRCCEPYKPAIAECNKKGTDLAIDTAAVRHGFCKRDCEPSFPVWCKQQQQQQNTIIVTLPFFGDVQLQVTDSVEQQLLNDVRGNN